MRIVLPEVVDFAQQGEGSELGLTEGLVEIPEDIVEGFEPNRNTHHVRGHSGGDLLFFAKLAVRRRRRVNNQRARVADIGEVAHKLGIIDKLFACRTTTLDAKGKN